MVACSVGYHTPTGDLGLGIVAGMKFLQIQSQVFHIKILMCPEENYSIVAKI